MKAYIVVRNWEELAKCKSDSYELEINTELGGGWIVSKRKDHKILLTTHAFYKENYKNTQQMLQDCGFDVILVSGGEL